MTANDLSAALQHHRKSFGFILSVLLLALAGLTLLPLQSCKPDEEDENCDTCLIVYKPNIYLYPIQAVKLTISISFPLGGKIIASEPAYQDGWKVQVQPNGLIDGKFTYLFYESRQPDRWQRTEGWVVAQADLSSFFDNNLRQYGFNENEITDFTDWWLQRLTFYPHYLIYPQTRENIDPLIRLEISTQPDRILRLFYLIEGVSALPAHLPSIPEIAAFERQGFVLTEWGVLMR